MKTRYICVTGGVISGLGKGLTAAALGKSLIMAGYTVTAIKLDPYLNIDPGTMSPYQHGEVFVTKDGAETDLDLGHYERFLDIELTKDNSITSGQVYKEILDSERAGFFLGGTVQVVPHVTNLVIDKILKFDGKFDFVLVEVGGTVGDIEADVFLESIRQLRIKIGMDRVAYVHLGLLIELPGGEIKTKAMQHSVKTLMSKGITPDFLVCRSLYGPVNNSILDKLSKLCGLDKARIIQNYNVSPIYKIVEQFHSQTFPFKLLNFFGEEYTYDQIEKSVKRLEIWKSIYNKPKNKYFKIAIVGKYTDLNDSYISVIEAINAASENIATVDLIDAETINEQNVDRILYEYSGILVPGGFGDRGIEGMIVAANYCIENNKPYFGICLGMQILVISALRKYFPDANSEEFDKNTPNPVIHIMKNQQYVEQIGGSMRLGDYKCIFSDSKSLAKQAYGKEKILERHRHRYEFNNTFFNGIDNYSRYLRQEGFNLSGWNDSTGEMLLEIIEKGDNILGCQFHPEFKSRPDKPHPLFKLFINNAKKYFNEVD